MNTIYLLINPLDESIFYVGITRRSLPTRLSQHIMEAYRIRQNRKGEIIRNILRNGLRPIIGQVATNATAAQEKEKINELTKQGCKLCNVSFTDKRYSDYKGIGDSISARKNAYK